MQNVKPNNQNGGVITGWVGMCKWWVLINYSWSIATICSIFYKVKAIKLRWISTNLLVSYFVMTQYHNMCACALCELGWATDRTPHFFSFSFFSFFLSFFFFFFFFESLVENNSWFLCSIVSEHFSLQGHSQWSFQSG